MVGGKRPLTASLIANLRAAASQGFPIVRALLNQARRVWCATDISVPCLCPLQFLASHRDPGAVLLLPFVVSCINLIVPRVYSAFRLVERYEMPRHEVTVLLVRYVCLSLPAPTPIFTAGNGRGARRGSAHPPCPLWMGRRALLVLTMQGCRLREQRPSQIWLVAIPEGRLSPGGPHWHVNAPA